MKMAAMGRTVNGKMLRKKVLRELKSPDARMAEAEK
jgi:hypothetical protein